MSDNTGSVCEFCGPVEKTFECGNCFHLYGIRFCEEYMREVAGRPSRPACPRCTSYCGNCEKLCYRSDLYPTRDWDVCDDCI